MIEAPTFSVSSTPLRASWVARAIRRTGTPQTWHPAAGALALWEVSSGRISGAPPATDRKLNRVRRMHPTTSEEWAIKARRSARCHRVSDGDLNDEGQAVAHP